MKVIVFGGTGWVGHNIVKVFYRGGFDVTVCSRGHKQDHVSGLPEKVRRLRADKTKPEDIRAIFETGYDVVIDSVPEKSTIDNLVEHAPGIRHYIHCSSTGGYAPLPFVPGDETCSYSHYMGGFEKKAVVDALALDYFNRRGFPATVIRPPNINGPGMVPLDNLGGRRQDFIPDILSGKTLDLPGDGRALLQPIHVEDLARSFLLAALQPKSIGQVYNICLEKALTLNRYLEVNARALGRRPEINHMPVDAMLSKYGEGASERALRFLSEHMCYDTGKARSQLGFVPARTTIEAVEETALWAAGKLSGV